MTQERGLANARRPDNHERRTHAVQSIKNRVEALELARASDQLKALIDAACPGHRWSISESNDRRRSRGLCLLCACPRRENVYELGERRPLLGLDQLAVFAERRFPPAPTGNS